MFGGEDGLSSVRKSKISPGLVIVDFIVIVWVVQALQNWASGTGMAWLIRTSMYCLSMCGGIRMNVEGSDNCFFVLHT